MSTGPASPTPWSVYRTGDKISIKDARGKFVLRKTVSQVSMEEYKRLSADFDAIVLAVNFGWPRSIVIPDAAPESVSPSAGT